MMNDRIDKERERKIQMTNGPNSKDRWTNEYRFLYFDQSDYVRMCEAIDVYLKRYYLYCFERWTYRRQEERERERTKVKMVQFFLLLLLLLFCRSLFNDRITIILNRTTEKKKEEKTREGIQDNNISKFCLV